MFDFNVDSEIWQRLCPPDWRTSVLCLRCFIHYCELAGIRIEDHLNFVDLATPSVSIRFRDGEVFRWNDERR